MMFAQAQFGDARADLITLIAALPLISAAQSADAIKKIEAYADQMIAEKKAALIAETKKKAKPWVIGVGLGAVAVVALSIGSAVVSSRCCAR